MELTTLNAVGYRNQKVPNTLIAQSNPTGHLGIILPGYRHSADMADLHYAERILLEQGADLLRVEYVYYQTDFLDQSEDIQMQWITEDVFAACNANLAYKTYTKITLIGKSLGANVMGFLIEDERFQKVECIWSTPLLTNERLCSQIEKAHPHSLFIIGTADKFYKPEILSRLEGATRGRSVIVEGADHGLEIPGSISKSLTALGQIVEALQEFLGGPANNT